MGIKESQELKQLQSRKAKLEVDLKGKRKDLGSIQNEVKNMESQLCEIQNKIKSISDSDIVVTEHAIIRYLERCKGLDLDAVKSEILSEERRKMIKAMGNGKFPIGDGARIVVKGNSIVTIEK